MEWQKMKFESLWQNKPNCGSQHDNSDKNINDHQNQYQGSMQQKWV